MLKTNPSQIELKEAYGYYNQGLYTKAIDTYKDILQNNPYNKEAFVGVALSLFKIGEYKTALQYINQGEKLGKRDLNLLNLKARILIGNREYEKARTILNRILKKDPTNLEALLSIAELTAIKTSLTDSLEKYKTILSKYPNNKRALLSIITILDKLNHLKEAENFLEIVLTHYYNDPLTHSIAAKFYLHNKIFDKANDELDKTIILGQKFNLDIPYIKIVISLLQNNAPEKIIENILSLINDEPRIPILRYLLAEAYHRINQPIKAIKSLENALILSPDNSLIRIVLENYIKEVYPIGDTHRIEASNYHLEKGLYYKKNYIYTQSLQHVRRAVQIAPLNKDNWFTFANFFKDEKLYYKYLDKLYAWKKIIPQSADNKELDKAIKIYESSLKDSIAKKWNINQFDIDQSAYSVILFGIDNPIDLNHIGITPHLLRYLQEQIEWYPQPLVLNKEPLLIKNISEAHVQAREKNTQIFAVMKLYEKDSNLHLILDIYETNSGEKIYTFSRVINIEKDIQPAFIKLAQDFDNLFPLQARFIKQRLNKAVINFGKINNLKEGDKWAIFDKEDIKDITILPVDKSIYDKAIGTLTLTNVDENVSEGNISLKSILRDVSDDNILLKIPEELANDEILNNENTSKSLEQQTIDSYLYRNNIQEALLQF